MTTDTIGVIYLATCSVNNKSYIGQTVDYEKRMRSHRKCEEDSLFHNAIRKYGYEAFHWCILEVAPESDLNDRERFWIASLNTIRPNGYNLTSGGQSGGHLSESTRKKISRSNKGQKRSLETRRKLSEAKKGKPSPRKGAKQSDETKAKLSTHNKANPSLGFKGKTHSPETRKRISELKKGNQNMKDKRHSDESRRKMSISAKKRFADPAERKKYSEYNKANPTRGFKGKTHSEDARRRISENQKKIAADPVERKRRSERMKKTNAKRRKKRG